MKNDAHWFLLEQRNSTNSNTLISKLSSHRRYVVGHWWYNLYTQSHFSVVCFNHHNENNFSWSKYRISSDKLDLEIEMIFSNWNVLCAKQKGCFQFVCKWSHRSNFQPSRPNWNIFLTFSFGTNSFFNIIPKVQLDTQPKLSFSAKNFNQLQLIFSSILLLKNYWSSFLCSNDSWEFHFHGLSKYLT